MSDSKRRYNCTLCVHQWLRAGKNPAAMVKEKVYSKRQIQYALDKMQSMGIIKKVGYGTWEVLLENLTERYLQEEKVQKIHRVDRHGPPPEGTKPDSVRAHGLAVVLKIPKIPGWERRAEIMTSSKIPWVKIPQGQRVTIGEIEKVWLCNGSIVYYLPWSWYADTAKDAAWQIIEDVTQAIVRTEKYLGIQTLKIQGGYKIRVSRQHNALIRNGLAKQYNRPGKRKLQVRDLNGLWLTIDNSSPDGKEHLNETELVRAGTIQEETKNIQDFFNSAKVNPGITPGFISDSLGKTAQVVGEMANDQAAYRKDLTEYGAKIAAHAKSIEELGTGIREMTGILKEMSTDQRKKPSKTYVTF